LRKTSSGLFDRIRAVFGGKPAFDAEMLADLEALLIAGDLGVKIVSELIDQVKKEIADSRPLTENDLIGILKLKLLSLFEAGAPRNPGLIVNESGHRPTVVLIVGVNGVGKTTTSAKLAAQSSALGAKVMLVAADTFRAAAVEQLQSWGRDLKIPVVSGAPEAKPATVVFDGMKRAQEEGIDLLIIDTAGRLHTKSNLMQELAGLVNTLRRFQPDVPHETLLVVDGSTGQNAIQQAREFNEATKLTGLVVTKLDGTPKGGVVAAIKSELGIPVRYIGVGEAKEDLRPFVAREFVEALFDRGEEPRVVVSAHGERRRRRAGE